MHEAEPALRPSVALIGRYPKQTACPVVVFPLIRATSLSGTVHDLVSIRIHGSPSHLYLSQKFALRTPLYINAVRSLLRR